MKENTFKRVSTKRKAYIRPNLKVFDKSIEDVIVCSSRPCTGVCTPYCTETYG